jgi:hypothetical protein
VPGSGFLDFLTFPDTRYLIPENPIPTPISSGEAGLSASFAVFAVQSLSHIFRRRRNSLCISVSSLFYILTFRRRRPRRLITIDRAPFLFHDFPDNPDPSAPYAAITGTEFE